MSSSDFDHTPAPAEQKSSVKISSNAKGEAQVELRAVEGVIDSELVRIRSLAVREYAEAMRALRPSAVPS